jgi:predicted kinase
MDTKDWETVDKKPKKENRRARRGEYRPPSWFLNIPPMGSSNENCDLSFEPFMLLLMGFPGSGKSTLALKLVELMPNKFVRINQDELGNRKKCLRQAEIALQQKKCPIIDRCNAGPDHRKPFYQLAAECGVDVNLVILEIPRHVCLDRCQKRPNHPTVSPHDAARVMGFMKRDWKLPDTNREKQLRNVWKVSDFSRDEILKLISTLRLASSSTKKT